MLQDPIIIGAFITAAGVILATLLQNSRRRRIVEDTGASQQPNSRTKVKVKNIFIFLSIATMGATILVWSLKARAPEAITNKWIGGWTQSEEWEHDTQSEGTLYLTIKEGEPDSLIGYSYNKNQERSHLAAKQLNAKTLIGTWKNGSTKKMGSFEFNLVKPDSFTGFYELNGVRKAWNGKNIPKNFSHEVSSKDNSGTIAFRSHPLTRSEIQTLNVNDTGQLFFNSLITRLHNGDNVIVISEHETQFKVVAQLYNEIRLGYIVNKINDTLSITPISP
jgi:hypothetical protein